MWAPNFKKLALASAFAVAAMTGAAKAQQTTGAPGSPSATTTIDGRYLPSPPHTEYAAWCISSFGYGRGRLRCGSAD